jgi:hypothetical protein
MSNSRVWISRVLTVAAAGLMLLTWFMPWWRATIDALADAAVMIHPWGLDHTLGPDVASLIEDARMPAYFAPFMWAYLGVCMLALLLSLFAKERVISLGKFKLSLPQVLVAGVGLSYVITLVVMVIYASGRTPDFYGIKFLGYTYIDMGEMATTGVTAKLLPGYWLAWAAALLLIVLGLLRNTITGSRQT